MNLSSRAVNGITLLELLISMIVLLILTSVSLPGYKSLIVSHTADQAVSKFVRGVALARSNAIRGSAITTLCKSNNGFDCVGHWEEGFIIFTDENADRKINGDDQLLHVTQLKGYEGTIKWRAFQNRQYLQFTSEGFTRYQNGNFTFCPKDSDPNGIRQLIVNRTARVRLAIDSDGDGYRENSRGKPVRC